MQQDNLYYRFFFFYNAEHVSLDSNNKDPILLGEAKWMLPHWVSFVTYLIPAYESFNCTCR